VPRQLPLLLTCAFVGYLFWRDVREKPNISYAVWIPLIWFLIIGSRPVSIWLSILFGISTSASLEDGSPIDRVVSSALIAGGCYVLSKRRISLFELVRKNRWLLLYITYCFLGIWWSDYAFVAFKRWIRAIGDPVMIVVLLSESDRTEAVTRLFKRATYILAPFSIMLIKYFPEIGRLFSVWGAGQSRGVAGDKNVLGRLCLILGFFLFCHVLRTIRLPASVQRRKELLLSGLLLWMIWWNLIESASSTALVALVVGMATLLALAMPCVNRRFIGAYALGAVLTLFALDSLFGIYDTLLVVLSKDPTLTGRTKLWDDLFAMDINPLVGVGFESFWLGERLEHLWSTHWWQPNEAHNGYLEVYLNLGSIGLLIIVVLLFVVYRKSRAKLLTDFEQGRQRLGFLAAFVLFSWTEAGFRSNSMTLLMFYLIAIDYPAVAAAHCNASVYLLRKVRLPSSSQQDFVSVTSRRPRVRARHLGA
jgi:exopolysaccharide production protein ExoQ